MRRRLNIALCIGMIENAFSYSVIDGAMLGAKDMDANLFIFPVGIINAQYENTGANYYRYQYNTLCSLIHEKTIDAVVIEYGTITSFLNEEQKKEFLQQFKGIPIVLVAGEQEGYSSVCVDNKTGLKEVITHLITERNCTKIGFVSGPETSQDAIERLEVYQSVVKEHNLALDEDWIVYGNFSEFSEQEVEELLTRHPDVEAIVCANDQMASGCYNTLRKHDLVPGEDVYVTGFDNSSTAIMLEPHLTSVKANTKELAYLAVKECEKVVKGEIIHEYVPTKMIIRESSGDNLSSGGIGVEGEIHFNSEQDIKNFADSIFDKYFNNYFESKETKEMRKVVEEYFDYYMHLVDDNGNLCLEHEEFLEKYQKFAVTYQKGYVELDCLVSIIYMLYHCINGKILSEKDRLALVEEITSVNQELMNDITQEHLSNSEKTKAFEVALTNITRDMLQNSDSEAKKYETIISKLRLMDFLSSYIFTYGEGITHERENEWVLPGHIYVKAYHNQDELHLYTGKEKRLSSSNLFMSGIMPKERRVSMLVMPIFSSVKQYGIILTEAELEYFRYASQIVCQVGVSVEVLEIMEKQNEIKKNLEKNLAKMEAYNKVLDAMSHTDALTGIGNRRGFEEAVRGILSNEANYGKRALALYADMDCLKIVNDEFGHDEGDFALKTIADSLVESFRSSDVVARMGGDEFAAFALATYDHFDEKIKKRIQGTLMEKNINDKPYYVNMSIGTYEFIIDENSDMDEIFGYADEALYKEKKNKVKVVYKDNK